MKILVAVKRVIDSATKIRVKADKSGVETEGVKMSMNPFDEIAVEEAVRLKEAGKASEVVAVSAGPEKGTDVLVSAMALGADRAIHVVTEETLDPLTISRMLAAVAARENPQLILTGKQATDDDAAQVPQMTAALLDWPQATAVCAVETDGVTMKATCEVDDGVQTVEMTLPAVVSADLRLNEPRFVSIIGMKKARKQPVESLSLAELGIDTGVKSKTVSVSEPPPRGEVKMLSSVAELVDRLRNEAKVI